MSKAKAFLFAAEEDFGIVPVEAQASGLPVIAYGKGGVTETVVENETGMFYDKLSPLELCNKIKEFEKIEDSFSREKIKEHSNLFSRDKFTTGLADYIEQCKMAKSNVGDVRHIQNSAQLTAEAKMKLLKKTP